MLARAAILKLIPQQGQMCLLDEVESWDQARILCRALSHLDPANPLRRRGRLPAVCGIEYGLQAAALHGALTSGKPQPPGFFASVREAHFAVSRLDDPRFGFLHIESVRVAANAHALLYAYVLKSASGQQLLSGNATIALSKMT
jgi:predicted hotdog family 3-hydroxylacyl-ACP dehydratase